MKVLSDLIGEGVGGNQSAFASGGGAGILWRATTVTVAPAAFGHTTVSVVDASVTPADVVLVQVIAGGDFDADDLDDVQVRATADAGAVLFTLSCDGPIVGTYRLLYAVGTPS